MSKTIIARKVAINASKEKVWEVLADFGNVQNLSPNIAKSYTTGDQPNGLGAERHCDFVAMGSQVEERITEWNEGTSMKIDIYERKNLPMVTGMGAEFVLSEENGQTIVTGTMEYRMSNAIGGFLNNTVMKKMNTKAWIDFMAGIKHNIETGEKVEKGTKLDRTPVMELS